MVWNPWGIITNVETRPVTAQDLLEAELPLDFLGDMRPRIVEVNNQDMETRMVTFLCQDETLEVRVEPQWPALTWYDQDLGLAV